MSEIKLTEQESQQLHYQVMGIALAIRGHEGDSILYHELDEAISGLDWRKLAIIQYAFEMLPTSRQNLILSKDTTDQEVVESIATFNTQLRSMLPRSSSKSA